MHLKSLSKEAITKGYKLLVEELIATEGPC